MQIELGKGNNFCITSKFQFRWVSSYSRPFSSTWNARSIIAGDAPPTSNHWRHQNFKGYQAQNNTKFSIFILSQINNLDEKSNGYNLQILAFLH